MASIVARKKADGTTTYTAQIRIKRDGKVIHSEARSFSRKAMAKAWAAEREAELKRNPERIGAPPVTMTLGEIIHLYIETRDKVAPLGRSKRYDMLALARGELGAEPITALTTQRLIAHAVERRAQGVAPKSAAHDLLWIRIVLKYARAALGIPCDIGIIEDAIAACRAERIIGPSRKRMRRPTDAELIRITEWFREKAKNGLGNVRMDWLVWVAIYSCRRLNELCAMRLSDYDPARGVWLIRKQKHPRGDSRPKPMVVTDRLRQVIETIRPHLKKDDDGRIFPHNPRSISDYWMDQMRVLGIEDLHFHDLRHEGCSRLAEDGLTIPQIQQVSLHESWSSLQVYVQIRPHSGERVEWSDWEWDE